jgi:hypothetical protein
MKMKGMWHIWGRQERHRNLKETNRVQDLGINGKIKIMGGDWSSFGSVPSPMVCLCEPLGSIKCWVGISLVAEQLTAFQEEVHSMALKLIHTTNSP